MLRFLAIAFVANCALALNVRPLTTPRHAISGCRAAIYLDEAAVEPSAIEKAMEMKAPKAKSKRINKVNDFILCRVAMMSACHDMSVRYLLSDACCLMHVV